jgi:epoxide hydrolase 4
LSPFTNSGKQRMAGREWSWSNDKWRITIVPAGSMRVAPWVFLLAGFLPSVAFAAKTRTPALMETYIDVNGVRLHCVTEGKGALILFLHGFPEFWYEWKNQLAEFGKDHLAVAPDMRGYHLSDKPRGVENYRVDVLVEDIRQLADHYRHSKKFVLVGHDWGGAVAWAFAMAHPDYLQKLVIINAPHPPIFARLLASDPAQQNASQYMLMFRSVRAESVLSADNYAVLTEVVLGEGLKTGAFTEEDKAAYLKAWSQPGALTGGLNYYRASRVGPPASPQVAAEIGASAANFAQNAKQFVVTVPTLVIWGEKDTALTVGNLDGLDEYVPQLTIKRVPDASHWVVHEKPAEVNGYIREFVR